MTSIRGAHGLRKQNSRRGGHTHAGAALKGRNAVLAPAKAACALRPVEAVRTFGEGCSDVAGITSPWKSTSRGSPPASRRGRSVVAAAARRRLAR